MERAAVGATKTIEAKSFKEQVYQIVGQIPVGRLMTYGQIAALCGSARSARIVGQVAHWGPMDLPWQRVVHKDGRLAGGYTTGGLEAHKHDLEAEGVKVNDDYAVDINRLLWWPPYSQPGTDAGSVDKQIMNENVHSKLVVIVGPTASGKSALALDLAKKFDGEIVCADSRTLYKYMDIGTAKPTQEELLQIPHHLLNIANPNEPFSVAQFKELALAAIEGISGRGNLPILVGGTGLYVDSILFDYQFTGSSNQESRIKNAGLSLTELVSKLQELDAEAVEKIDLKNRRRVERAIETAGMPKLKSIEPRANSLVLGLALDKKLLQQRIEQRINNMLGKGLIEEVKRVGTKFGWNNEALKSTSYLAFKDVVLGTKTIEEGIEEFARRDLNLAKRQMTWFKRNKEIVWLDTADQLELTSKAEQLVAEFLLSVYSKYEAKTD